MVDTSRTKQAAFALAATVIALVFIEVAATLVLMACPDIGLWNPESSPPAPVANVGLDNYRVESGFRRLREAQGLTIEMVEDEAREWKLAPGAFVMRSAVSSGVPIARINSRGFRGPELEPRRPREVRIMALGDSTLFGFGVAEKRALLEVAARRLEHLWQRPVTAVNAATPGYDSEQCLNTLREHGPAVAPDIVLVASLWSDLSPLHYHPTPDDASAVEPDSLLLRVTRPLSRLATFRLMQQLLGEGRAPARVGFLDDWRDIEDDAGFDARMPPARYRSNLNAIEQEAAALSATVIFLTLPAPIDFAEGEVPARITGYRNIMRDVAQRSRSLFVDGLAAFRQRGGRVAYFLDQVHPAPEGHRILGEAVADALAQAFKGGKL